jgi:hypothetical protein
MDREGLDGWKPALHFRSIEKASKFGGFDDEDVPERASYGGFEP